MRYGMKLVFPKRFLVTTTPSTSSPNNLIYVYADPTGGKQSDIFARIHLGLREMFSTQYTALFNSHTEAQYSGYPTQRVKAFRNLDLGYDLLSDKMRSEIRGYANVISNDPMFEHDHRDAFVFGQVTTCYGWGVSESILAFTLMDRILNYVRFNVGKVKDFTEISKLRMYDTLYREFGNLIFGQARLGEEFFFIEKIESPNGALSFRIDVNNVAFKNAHISLHFSLLDIEGEVKTLIWDSDIRALYTNVFEERAFADKGRKVAADLFHSILNKEVPVSIWSNRFNFDAASFNFVTSAGAPFTFVTQKREIELRIDNLYKFLMTADEGLAHYLISNTFGDKP